ncbi:MAG: hypothetical protein WC091_04540 [Sulfuricellaceae bacterium]
MSSPQNAITPALFTNPPPVTFIAASGTVAKVVVDVTPGAVAMGTQPALYGGCTVIDLTASSTDVLKNINLYIGSVTTTIDASTNTGATTSTATTNATLVRTLGSWIADGYRVGDLVMLFAPTASGSAFLPQSVEGVLATVTGVAALTITFNGVPAGWTAITVSAGTRVCRVVPHMQAPIAANSGSNGSVPSVGLLGNGMDGSSVKTELKLGQNNLLIAAMAAAVGALPAYVSVAAVTALY